MFKWIITYLLVVFFINNTFATHIVGGEMSYEYVGNNQYRITLKVYRDCINGVAQFDNPASVGIFNSSGTLIQEVLISNPTITNLPVVVTNPCLQVPPVICTEEAIYQKIVTLSSIPSGGLDLVYQRCCRNSIIQNIVNPQDMGSTYISHIPDPALAVNNTGAHFKNVPPLVLCNGDNFVFDHSAIDADGDLLIYEMCLPYHGASSFSPMPQPPNGAPYTNISWAPGFGTTHQINGTQNLQIDSNTGELICTPTTNGVYVVGICVKEYRNGVLINSTLRDFQFTVVTCSSNVISAVPSQTVLCDGYTMEFQNNSINSSFYYWDFGVPGINTDTSSLEEPVYTYPDTGNYEVTLIANPGWPCADTSTAVYSVQYPIQGAIDNVMGQCLENNSFDFAINGNFTPSALFNWNFGGASVPASSTQQNPSGVVYNSDGVYTVTSSVSDRGCQRDFTQQVEVYSMPVAEILDIENCDGLQVTAINNSTNAIGYRWDFGDNTTQADTSLLPTPSYTYSSSGSYSVMLVANNLHCSDTAYATYKVKEPINPVIQTSPAIQCLIGNSYDFTLSGNYTTSATFNWNFGSPTNGGNTTAENPQGIEYLVPGIHHVQVSVEDEGCIKDTVLEINVVQEPTADFDSVFNCNGLTAVATNNSVGANSYYWDFGDLSTTTDNSTLENPSYTYPSSNIYNVMLVAYNDYCSDTAYNTFKVKEPINPSFDFNLNPQCITTNSFDFTLSGNYTSSASFTWVFGANAVPSNAVIENPSGVVFSTEGYYPVLVSVEDEGCVFSYSDTAKVFPSPNIQFSISDTVGCMPLTTSFIDESIAWGDVDYLWTFGDGTTSTEHEPTHIYSSAGVYDVSFSLTTNQGCLETLTLNDLEAVHVYPRPHADFNLSPEQTNIFFPEIELTDLSTGAIATQYYSIEGNYFYESDFIYSVVGMGSIPIFLTVINSYGCEDTLTKYVYIEPNDLLYVPNSFSPNNDGINDVFKPISYGITKFEFYIFNRWGQIIYEGTDASVGWDGASKGKLVKDGVYIWKIRYKDHKNHQQEKVGHLTLFR